MAGTPDPFGVLFVLDIAIQVSAGGCHRPEFTVFHSDHDNRFSAKADYL